MSGLVSAITKAFAAFDPISFAIQMVASAILSKLLAPSPPSQAAQSAPDPNPGSRAQTPPAGNNKLPVVYGQAWTGGIITDLSITNDNQTLYYVFALSEVTNTESGSSVGSADEITFGDIYWGGKKCIFDGVDTTKVIALEDPSTNESQDISGYMNIYLYKNGSNAPANSTTSAITVMSNSNLTYQWDSSKLMTNCAFAIIQLKYSQSRNLIGLSATNFEIFNARKAPGDCFLDYLTSTRYGASIPLDNIDTTSLTALNVYSNETITYTPYSGGSATMKRFEYNGSLDTSQKLMKNIQSMADCCDCLVKYNEITGLWGVIVQTPTYTVAMDINDTNMIGPISISPIDISNSFNIIECKFPDGSQQDSFNAATFDLQEINPSLLFPNEPVNKQSVSLYLTNNSVTAQYIANRMLEAAREDLQIQCEINYIGLELEAGDIVTVTNVNYGWSAKLFRIMKVIEKFGDNGTVTATLSLSEYNPAIYDDYNVTSFIPANNSGLGSPVTFGTVYPPTIVAQYPTNTNPSFVLRIQTSSAGISDYAEIYYSAYQYPTDDQLIFAGTTAIQPVGVPYVVNTYMPDVTLTNIPTGDWYFFSRMVNSLASSNYSLASTVLVWRPTTFQYVEKYLSVAYADNITGTSNFNLNPRNRTYYGLANQTSTTPSTNPSDYSWYLADPTFATNKFLAYSNRTGRKFSFATDQAAYAAGTASFVPTTASLYDPSVWSALPDGLNIIDLDVRTGQLIGTGTTTTATGEIAIVNTADGQVVAALAKFLDFGGPSTFTGDATTLTIDVYGRVVGFSAADSFYMTINNFVATSGQTVFSVTRDAAYIVGQCLVYENGILLSQTDFTDASSSVTLSIGATVGANITVVSMRAISTSTYYDLMNMSVLSVASNVVTWNNANAPWDLIEIGDTVSFTNVGTPTHYTVTGVDYVNSQITFSSPVTSVVAGSRIYFYRAAGSSYRIFSRYTTNQTNASSYTPTLWSFDTGFELPFINGAAMTALDYNLSTNTYSSVPNVFSGDLDIIQFTGNNLTTPTGSIVNMIAYTVIGQVGYPFNSIPNALNVYMNGALLVGGTDYTSTTTSYTLTVTPLDNTTIMGQQTFARYGAA
jgi:hypothetical protein